MFDRNFGSEKKEKFEEKNVGSEKFGSEQSLGSKFFLDPIKLLVRKLGFLKISGLKKNLGIKKFGPRRFWSTKIISPKKLDPKSLVKIEPVTVEILLI